jgi:hypothetical protein
MDIELQTALDEIKRPWVGRLVEALDDYRQYGKQNGYKVLKAHNLHEDSRWLAGVTLSKAHNGARVVSLGLELGEAVVPDASKREQLEAGYYLIYTLTKAGIYRLRTLDGYDPWNNHVGNRSPYRLELRSGVPNLDGAISRRPFDKWTSPKDSANRRLVHSSSKHWQPDNFTAEFVRGVNRLESVAFQINKQILNLYTEFGSQKPEGEQLRYKRAVPDKGIKKGDLRYDKDGIAIHDRTSIEHDDETAQAARTYTDSSFYIRHFLDHRGRVYSSESTLNIQDGGDLARGLMEFREPSVLNEEAIDSILLSTANHVGIKGSVEYRLEKARVLLPEWKRVGSDPVKYKAEWLKQDSPWQVIRHFIELATKTIGDDSHLATESDQSCSAMAWVALLERDRTLAKMTNLTEDYVDFYSEVAKSLDLEGCDDAEKRLIVKVCALPFNYGSGIGTMALSLWDKRKEEGYVSNLKPPIEPGSDKPSKNRKKAYNVLEGEEVVQTFKLKREADRYTKENPAFTVAGVLDPDDSAYQKRVPSEALTKLAEQVRDAITESAPAQARFKERFKDWARVQLDPRKRIEELRESQGGAPDVEDIAKQYPDKSASEVIEMMHKFDAESVLEHHAEADRLEAEMAEYDVVYADLRDQAKEDEQLPEDVLNLEYPYTDYISWDGPTGFKVVLNKPQLWPGFRAELHWVDPKSGRTSTTKGCKSVRPTYQVETSKPRVGDLVTSVMANAIHSMDAALVHRVSATADFPMAVVHDAFLTTPGHQVKLRKLLLESLRSLEQELPDAHKHVYPDEDWGSTFDGPNALDAHESVIADNAPNAFS